MRIRISPRRRSQPASSESAYISAPCRAKPELDLTWISRRPQYSPDPSESSFSFGLLFKTLGVTRLGVGLGPAPFAPLPVALLIPRALVAPLSATPVNLRRNPDVTVPRVGVTVDASANIQGEFPSAYPSARRCQWGIVPPPTRNRGQGRACGSPP